MKKNIVFVFLFIAGVRASASAQEFTIDLHKTAQVIDNFGASGCWYSENIGLHWAGKKEQIAEWLFSKGFDDQGNPKGIGLSAWRFNIGGGTAEQGDSSGLRDPRRRVECFQAPDGSYDWNKQSGYVWFVRKARDYGVENLIAFSNTPPVQFTKNGYGFKTEKDFRSNLREDKYGAYAAFLGDVADHFAKSGLPFSYISPVNEPQWDWSGKPGSAGQEGSPWTNAEIARVASSLDSVLTARKLTTKILLTEAGQLNYLYGGSGPASKQIQTLYGGPLLSHVGHFIGGHSYFSESNDTVLVKVRRSVADTAARYGIGYWETEYSMLANGWQEGTKGKRSALDCALFLAKVIHNDLVVGNASAWQFWNSYEPGSPDSNTRYYLIALTRDSTGFAQTKNLWAFGNFSRFIRPGMRRVVVDRGDGLDDLQATKDVMVSAYTDGKRVVVVAINTTFSERPMRWKLMNGPGGVNGIAVKKVSRYVTSAVDNLKYYAGVGGALPARSVTTFVIEVK